VEVWNISEVQMLMMHKNEAQHINLNVHQNFSCSL